MRRSLLVVVQRWKAPTKTYNILLPRRFATLNNIEAEARRLLAPARQRGTRVTASEYANVLMSLSRDDERWNDIYQAWLLRSDHEDHLPFRHVMKILADSNMASEALHVLETWNAKFAGDIERAPNLSDYHVLLGAYRDQPEASEVANEVLLSLQEWGFSMQPTMETYALAAECGAVVPKEEFSSTPPTRLSPRELNFYARYLIAAIPSYHSTPNHLFQELTSVVKHIDELSANAFNNIAKAAFKSQLDTEETATLLLELSGKVKEQEKKSLFYLNLIKAWHPSSNRDSKEKRISEWVSKLTQHASEGNTMAQNNLMEAFLVLGNIAAVRSVFSSIQHKDTFSHDILLAALAQSGHRTAAAQALDVLGYIQNPNEMHFANCMLALSKSKMHDLTKHCEKLISRMTELGIKPNAVHYSILLQSMKSKYSGKSIQSMIRVYREAKKAGELNDGALVAFLSALAQTRRLEAADVGKKIILTMEQQGRTLPVKAYTSVMYAMVYSKSPQAYQECLKLFRAFRASKLYGTDENFVHSPVSYRALVEALLVLDEVNLESAKKALGHLSECIQGKSEGRFAQRPDVKLYNSVMRVYVLAGTKPEEVEKIYGMMKKDVEDGNAQAKLDATTTNLLLRSLAMDSTPDNVQKAWGHLKFLISEYKDGNVDMMPSSYTLSYFLKVLEKEMPRGYREEAIQIAIKALDELNGVALPGLINSHSYRLLLKVISVQFSAEEDKGKKYAFGKLVFERCCREGHTNRIILNLLKSDFPALYLKIPLDEKDQPPKAWTRKLENRSMSNT